MPGITIERPKMTRVMYQSLKKHIVRERERKKQEQEHDKAMEQQRKEQELRKKKEQEDSLTLGQTKDQIDNLESRLEHLKNEKHELFSQLKKVLHQEDENRKKAQLKEHNEMISLKLEQQQQQQQQQQQYSTSMPAHPIFMQTHIQQRGSKYLNVPMHTPVVPGVKRARSPSPPPQVRPMFPHYAGSKYPAASTTFQSQVKRDEAYPIMTTKVANYPSTQVTYAIQAGHPYPQPHAAQQHSGPPTHQTVPHQAPPHQAPPPHPTPPRQAPPHQTPLPHQGPPSHQGPPHQAPSSHQAQAHQIPPSSHTGPPATQHKAMQLQTPSHPPSHPGPPSQHQGLPTQHQAPPSQHQGQPPQHQGPPPHQPPGPQHQGPPPHNQAPPPQHVPTQHVPPPQHQAPLPHAAPPRNQAPPSQQLQAPPHHGGGQHPPQGGPPTQHQGSQSQSSKLPPGQSAFQSYSNHYAHQQKGMPERMPPQGYPVQRGPQPGFGSPHTTTSLSLQQQLEHANQKSGFSEDKFKMQQQPIRGVAPISQQPGQMLSSAQLPTSQPPVPQPRQGSIVTGYPIRTQASSSSSFQPPSTQSTHSPHTAAPRHSYGGQGQYY